MSVDVRVCTHVVGHQLFLEGQVIERDQAGDLDELGRKVYPTRPEPPEQQKHIGMETELQLDSCCAADMR